MINSDFNNSDTERAEAGTLIARDAPKSVQHATGHESMELFGIGCMLLLVREGEQHTLNDLANCISSNWTPPPTVEEAYDLIDRVQHGTNVAFRLIERLHQVNIDKYLEHMGEPGVVDNFLAQLDYFKNNPRLGSPILSILDFKVVLCAEIWCAWAYEGRCPLPDKTAFLKLFGSEIAKPLAVFVSRLARADEWEDIHDYLSRWYGCDLALPLRIDTLISLVDDP
ncbi:hypothetical protein F5Y16DRAFT_399418 [Xylariaceae sp. FL0255]|nr:hypothetical protein F5Y16DRAFT_399418 [Xylariaceae sp. FL0255]